MSSFQLYTICTAADVHIDDKTEIKIFEAIVTFFFLCRHVSFSFFLFFLCVLFAALSYDSGITYVYNVNFFIMNKKYNRKFFELRGKASN